jgi:SAM-dependent MidA family methyltransferase
MLLPTTSPAALPAPSSDALQQSAALAAKIHDEISRAGGWIDFSRFMELALYAPGLGYYSAGSTKLGPSGDFVTAPEISTALGRALALTLDAELAALDAATVLELGAGSGALAAQLLDTFATLGRDVRYLILEPSADLRERQRRELRRFGEHVTWLDGLPREPFAGVVVANEVLDALPVSRFGKTAGVTKAVGVVSRGAGFAWSEAQPTPALASAVDALERRLAAPLADGYRSEWCPALPAWLQALAAVLERGCVIFTDYGLVRTEYYHEQRASGTLVCHYRHRAHGDPFVYPGLQDITAWVDFSACADAAVAAGFEVAGFTTQGQYLLSVLAAAPQSLGVGASSPQELSALKTLILPGEMGERFKVLLLRKDCDGPPLPGRDLRHRL